jgi:hypothetical protein
MWLADIILVANPNNSLLGILPSIPLPPNYPNTHLPSPLLSYSPLPHFPNLRSQNPNLNLNLDLNLPSYAISIWLPIFSDIL